jgi:hypothetical protein
MRSLLNSITMTKPSADTDELTPRERAYLDVAVQRTIERNHYQSEAERLQTVADGYQKLYFSRLSTFHKLLDVAVEVINENYAPHKQPPDVADLIALMKREMDNRPVWH